MKRKVRRRTRICAGCGAEAHIQFHSKATHCKKCVANSGRLPSVPWNKGIKNFRPGYRHSTETRAAIGAGHRSNDRPRKTPANTLDRKSTRYREWRSAVFNRDKFTCQECGARSRRGCRVELHAHHLKEFAFYKELRFDVDNGLTLCRGCHVRTPSFGKQTFDQAERDRSKAAA